MFGDWLPRRLSQESDLGGYLVARVTGHDAESSLPHPQNRIQGYTYISSGLLPSNTYT